MKCLISNKNDWNTLIEHNQLNITIRCLEEYGVVFVGTQNIISQLKICLKDSVCTLCTIKMFNHFFLITQTFLQHYQSDTQVLFFFNNVNHKKFIETAKIQQTTLNFQLTHAQLSYKKKKFTLNYNFIKIKLENRV